MCKIIKEVIAALEPLGYSRKELENVENIDVGLCNKDKTSNQVIVTYALYTDEDFKNGDTLEFGVENDSFWIKENGEVIKDIKCKFDFDKESETAIGDFYVVE